MTFCHLSLSCFWVRLPLCRDVVIRESKWTRLLVNLLDVRLVNGNERGVDGDCDCCQMEIVEKNGQVVV